MRSCAFRCLDIRTTIFSCGLSGQISAQQGSHIDKRAQQTSRDCCRQGDRSCTNRSFARGSGTPDGILVEQLAVLLAYELDLIGRDVVVKQ
jgi:hypothetical protein